MVRELHAAGYPPTRTWVGERAGAATRGNMVLEHTVGALITRFASKYIDNLDLSALRLSVFGGDVVLRNLELNLEVLRRDFAAGLPIEFQRGYVREIRIHIPWLKLASEPIELTIDTVELVASLLPPDTASGRSEAPDSSGASAEAPAELGGGSASADGWMGPLLTKALFNMSVRKSTRCTGLVAAVTSAASQPLT